MVKNIKAVKDAYINEGRGVIDFLPTLDEVKPDVFVVNVKVGLITISLEPTFEVRDRCGLSTSTRKVIQKIWSVKLPKMDPEMLARLVFCFENNPERHDGIISGAQDSIGICVPGPHGGGSGMEDAGSRRRWLSGTGGKGQS